MECIRSAELSYSFRLLCEESEVKLKNEMKDTDNIIKEVVQQDDDSHDSTEIESYEVMEEKVHILEENIELKDKHIKPENKRIIMLEEHLELKEESSDMQDGDLGERGHIEIQDQNEEMQNKNIVEMEVTEYVIEIPEDDDCELIETDVAKNVCSVCHFDFPTVAALNKHLTSHLVKPTYYRCQHCSMQ